MKSFLGVLLFGLMLTPTFASAEIKSETKSETFRSFRLVGNLTFDRFEQQVKQEVGGAKGEKLVVDNSLGLLETSNVLTARAHRRNRRCIFRNLVGTLTIRPL